MGLGDLFKSKKERERELRRKQRRAFRQAEDAINTVKQRIAKMIAERDRAWEEARGYLKGGQKTAARRSLQGVRANELMIDQLEKKRWVFEQLITRLEISKTDQEFALALGAINTVIEIDPETVEDVLDAVDEKLGEQVDVDRIWENMHSREMGEVTARQSDVVPSIDDMMSNLEDEAVADVRGSRITEPTSTDSVSDQIGEGRERLKKLMDDEKQEG